MTPLKTENEIAVMRDAGRMLAQMMQKLAKEIRPGIPTSHFEAAARRLIRAYGVEPAFLGYKSKKDEKPFPAVICVSVNEEIVHMPPGKRVLQEGDIVTLDFGIQWKGWNSDHAITFPVGRISKRAEKLISVTREALERATQFVKAGVKLGDLAHLIQSFVERQGFSVVRNLVGHGIGRKIHEDPMVPNFGKAGEGLTLRSGMVIAIEPMVVADKDPALIKTKDGFGYASASGKLTAHFEHTVAIREHGAEILTVP